MKKAIVGYALCLFFALTGCTHVSNLADAALESVGWRGSFKETGDPNLTKRAVIVPFRAGKPDLEPQAKAMQQAVQQAFMSDPHIKTIEFRELQKASIEFGAAELVAEDRYLTGARNLGINVVVVGDISGMYVDYNLEGWYGFRNSMPQIIMEGQIRLVDGVRGIVHTYRNFKERILIDDVEAQAILTGQPPKPEQVRQLIDSIIANNLPIIMEDVRNLPWSGMVLKVRDNQVLISGGQDTGFQPGNTLVLYGQSARITTGGGHSIYLLGRPAGKINLNEVQAETAWGEVVFDEKEVSEDNQEQAQVYDVQPGQIVRTR